MDPRRAPARVRLRHRPNQRADFGGHRRSPDPASTLPGPPEPEALSVPGDDGLRLDDDEHRSPSRPEARARPRGIGPSSRAALVAVGCAGAPATGAVRRPLRAGVRRANAPLFGATAGSRRAPIARPSKAYPSSAATSTTATRTDLWLPLQFEAGKSPRGQTSKARRCDEMIFPTCGPKV